MPPANKQASESLLFRGLAYGPDKTKKTWWALNAAKSGYNVILLNGDDGAHILSAVDDKIKDKIHILNVFDKPNQATYSQFMAKFLKGKAFAWDEQARGFCILPSNANKEHSHYAINSKLLTSNDFVIMDSYTALVRSLIQQFANENKLDLSDAEKQEWDGYRWCGMFASWCIEQFTLLPCHVLMIGHETVYEKYEGTGKERKLKDQRTQLISTSGPHGKTICNQFSDVLYFYKMLDMFKIDTASVHNRDGGCRNIKPGQYNWPDMQFEHLRKSAGLPMPDSGKECTAFKYYAPGIIPELNQSNNGNNNKQTNTPIHTQNILQAKLQGKANVVKV